MTKLNMADDTSMRHRFKELQPTFLFWTKLFSILVIASWLLISVERGGASLLSTGSLSWKIALIVAYLSWLGLIFCGAMALGPWLLEHLAKRPAKHD